MRPLPIVAPRRGVAAGVLAPTTRMMHQALGWAPPRQGQAEGVGDEGFRDALARRPADGTARVEIRDQRQVEPALAGSPAAHARASARSSVVSAPARWSARIYLLPHLAPGRCLQTGDLPIAAVEVCMSLRQEKLQRVVPSGQVTAEFRVTLALRAGVPFELGDDGRGACAGGLHHEYPDGRREPIGGIGGVPRAASKDRPTTRSSTSSALAGRYRGLSRLTKIGLAASHLAP